ncbi:hypothetical protein D3C80_1202070 [compost metagenome]
MVNHHHVGVHRGFTRFDDKTIFIHWAVAAKAVIVGTGDQRPRLRIFRDARTGADVPVGGLIRPCAQNNHVAESLYRQVTARKSLRFEALQTEIV